MKKSNLPWYERPMRWAQLTLADNDPINFDTDYWLDYFRRIKADAVCLSAGGYIAYYPTNIPFHHRSTHLGERDIFGELVEGCRKMDMVILARIDPHAARQDVCDAHPDWIAVDADGQKRRHWAMPELWVTCALGPYNAEFMTQVNREIAERYDIDGIFGNRWAGSGVCYCEHCQRGFREFSGAEIPQSLDPRDHLWKQYLLWRQKRLFEIWQIWDQAIRAVRPNACFIPNSGGGALSDLDMVEIGKRAPTLFIDRQARRGVMPPWQNGKNAKEIRATFGSKPVGGIFGVGIEEEYRWKDSVQSPDEMRLWVADGIAHGMRPWFTKFAATVDDTRWMPVVEEIYQWHWANERYLDNKESLASVAIVYSQQTAHFYGGKESRKRVEDHLLGYYHALVEARIPFDMVHDRLLDKETLSRYKALILPNIAALSDEQCQQLRRYVDQGGSLIATHETSLYNEWGEHRGDFALGSLFGIRYGSGPVGPVKNAYLRLELDDDARERHPLLSGFHGLNKIIHGIYHLDVKSTSAPSALPLTVIPPFPDLPMEEVYARIPRTDIPGVYLREIGESRLVYFPWDIDRSFWEILNPDHGRLLANAVRWVLRDEMPVTVTGPGVLDVAVWRQDSSITVHLVNLTNPMMMKGPIRELYPVGAQQVRIRLPKGVDPKAVKLLKLDRSVPFHIEDEHVVVSVPSILDHEVVAVDL